MAEINVYANNRTGLLVDLSKIFTERKIDVRSMNSRTNKQEKATISLSFNVRSKEELNSLIEKIRQVESVIDVERTTGYGCQTGGNPAHTWSFRPHYGCRGGQKGV